MGKALGSYEGGRMLSWCAPASARPDAEYVIVKVESAGSVPKEPGRSGEVFGPGAAEAE